MAHTPGPWKLVWWGNEQYPYPLSINTADDGGWIARDGTISNSDDAHLLAAAPEMLAEMQAAAGYLRNARIDLQTSATKATAIRTIDGGLKRLEAAIAKAEGN